MIRLVFSFFQSKKVLMILFLALVNFTFAQTKRERRIEKREIKRTENLRQRENRLKNPIWLKVDKEDSIQGFIDYSPFLHREKIDEVIYIVAFWHPKIQSLKINILDPCGERDYVETRIIEVYPKDLSLIRSYEGARPDGYLESEDYELPPLVWQNINQDIRIGCKIKPITIQNVFKLQGKFQLLSHCPTP